MNATHVDDLLNQIAVKAKQIAQNDPKRAADVHEIEKLINGLREELAPPQDDNTPRTRDQISPREWAEYEWHDVTAFGDRQRMYIRGLKR